MNIRECATLSSWDIKKLADYVNELEAEKQRLEDENKRLHELITKMNQVGGPDY